jgi:hypothetical protein
MNITKFRKSVVLAGRTISLFIGAALLTHLLAGCGGGGGSSSGSASNTTPPAATNSASSAQSSFRITEDTYGLQSATYLTATQGSGTLVLRAAIATSLTDPAFKTVLRIDVTNPSGTAPGTYTLGSGGTFPGDVLIFDGHPSTMLQTVSGTVTFTSFGTNTGDLVAGNLSLVFQDRNTSATPPPAYTCKAEFSFYVNTSGPAPAMPQQANGALLYDGKCSSCHGLGSYDPSGTPDLSLKGGEMNGLFSADVAGHKNITLSTAEIQALKVFLNAN